MISVVIPAYNEEPFITQCLSSLRQQVFQQPFEVLVVNNGSTDQTAAAVVAYQREYPNFPIRLLEEPRRGIAQACQTGFMAAQYNIVARTDADSIVAHNWLARLAYHFEQPTVVAVGGYITYENKDIFSYLANLFRSWHAQVQLPFYCGANMALLREAFQKIGGFDTTLQRTEDIDISRRLWIAYPQPGALLFDAHLIVNTSLRKYRRLRGSKESLKNGIKAYITNVHGYLKYKYVD